MCILILWTNSVNTSHFKKNSEMYYRKCLSVFKYGTRYS